MKTIEQIKDMFLKEGVKLDDNFSFRGEKRISEDALKIYDKIADKYYYGKTYNLTKDLESNGYFITGNQQRSLWIEAKRSSKDFDELYNKVKDFPRWSGEWYFSKDAQGNTIVQNDLYLNAYKRHLHTDNRTTIPFETKENVEKMSITEIFNKATLYFDGSLEDEFHIQYKTIDYGISFDLSEIVDNASCDDGCIEYTIEPDNITIYKYDYDNDNYEKVLGISIEDKKDLITALYQNKEFDEKMTEYLQDEFEEQARDCYERDEY